MKIDRDLLRGVAGVALAFLVIAAIHQLRPTSTAAPDYPCAQSNETANISISAGESGSSIATKLRDADVTKSFAAFFRVAVADSRSASIAPGIHQIHRRICAKDALVELIDSANITNLLAINEGAWNTEIVTKLVALGFSRSEIKSAMSSVTLPQGYSALEGLLFPAQYSFDTSTSITEVLNSLVSRGLKEVSAAGINKAIGKYSPGQLLIIASLVQAEGDPEDYPKISQVVRNRLAIGMPLQFDSTVHYVKGVRGSVFLSTQSTYINSPYNTYKHYGLPPAPINNPGVLAMKAAGAPAAGDWLYFITVAPGDTRFTAKIDEFNQWKALYKKNLKAGKFRSNK